MTVSGAATTVASTPTSFADVPAFVRELTFADLPDDVVAQAQRCLLDLIGVAAAGSRTPAAAVVNAYAATQLCARDEEARILFDGRRASMAGAAFAGATTIDAIDAHDGHVLTKAQPAIEAALSLKRAHRLSGNDVVGIGIESFREAIDLGSQCRFPATTDEAQYSVTFAVAAALAFGQLGADEIDAKGLADPRVKRLLESITLNDDAEFSRRFPAERWARVRITLRDGRTLVSDAERARGNPGNPLADDELRAKYREFAVPVLGADRATRIETAVATLVHAPASLSALIDELLHPTG